MLKLSYADPDPGSKLFLTQDPKSFGPGIRDGKFGSGIRDKHPLSATLVSLLHVFAGLNF